MLLGALDGDSHDSVHVKSSIDFLAFQNIACLPDREFSPLFLFGNHVAEHLLKLHAHFFESLSGEHLDPRARSFLDINLDFLVLKLARQKLFARAVADSLVLIRDGFFLIGHADLRNVLASDRSRIGLPCIRLRGAVTSGFSQRKSGKKLDQTVVDSLVNLVLDFLRFFRLDQANRTVGEIAHHALDIAADIADLGVFGRLDFYERRLRERGKPSGDFRLADTGRADHEDIFRHDLLALGGGKERATVAVSEGNRNGALGLVLTDNVAVKLGDNFFRCKSR